MPEQRQSLHGQWTSRWIFILAVTGSAVGLGNIWKFPYITGENGGGAFVLIYLACILVLGIPVMMCEILLGRRGRRNPAESVSIVAQESNRSPNWKIVGGIGTVAAFIILSFYCVIAGWSLDYVFIAASGNFNNVSATQVQTIFDNLMASPGRLMLWSTLILLFTMYIISRGVNKGLEIAIRFMFPLMLLLLLALVGYSMNQGSFQQGLSFLFSPDFSKISANGVLIALGHAFFTLSLASGAVIMYGAYLSKQASITRSTFIIATADTLIALLAGLAIFPIVFANGLEPSSGPGLIFQTLPIAFGQMPYGSVFATTFFAMVVFAAFTSTIAMLEPSVTWLVETYNMSRRKAAFSATFALWLVSIGSVLSFNYWSDVKLFGLTYFDISDYLTANIMLPLGGLLTAFFVGWIMKPEYILDELQIKDGPFFQTWCFALRFIVPLGVSIVFLNALNFI